MFLLIEFTLCLIALALAFLAPRLGEKWFSNAERALNRLAQRRGWAVVTVGAIALATRAALLPVEPIPLPQIHDEFSYLLMSDTFSHARLANPTHPMWVHFETFHVNQAPRYVSIYYPAQGAFLAFGQVVFGHPFWGVWLSVGLMCAAICWMLQAWLPPFWALLGGLLAVIRLGTFSYWADSYWGGAVAAIGGALVLGSLPRIMRYCRTQDALILGFGFVILGNSRPYEGLLLGIPVLAIGIKWLFGRKFPFSISFKQVMLPLVTVLVMGAAWMLYYFWRTTGNPFTSPYVLNLQTYNPVPFFPWQKLAPIPHYRHPEMADLYLGWWLFRYSFSREHPFLLALTKSLLLWMFFLGTVFLLPLIVSAVGLPYGMGWRDLSSRTRRLLLITLFGILAVLLPIYIQVHYAAPWTGVIYLWVLISMQSLRKWRRPQKTGVAVVRFTFLTCLLLLFLRIAVGKANVPEPLGLATWSTTQEEIPGRAKVLEDLSRRPGKLLVLVRYRVPRDPGQSHYEWVHNAADIDRAQIVWAHDMGFAANQELLNYFHDRDVWIVEPDEDPVKVMPYSSAAQIDQGVVPALEQSRR